jgi:hypothetical protein
VILSAGHLICNQDIGPITLYRCYPRLTKPPLYIETDEMLGGVVEGLLKAMRSIGPQTVRQFFALANQHLRWQLNDLARRLDKQAGLGNWVKFCSNGATEFESRPSVACGEVGRPATTKG